MRISSLLLLPVLSAVAADRVVLLDENFADLANWTDMSRAVDWGTASSPPSAFSVAGGVAQIAPEAFGWTGYFSATGLRTFTNLDFQFPEAVDHASSVLTVEFRVRFNQLFFAGKGESNRFVVTVQHDYPLGGLNVSDPSLVTNPAGAPWARPAYQIRMRGANDTQLDANNRGSTILQYGGGTVPEGEYEYLQDFGWWVPGFNASALGNGTHPSGNVTPPGEYSHGGPFPFNSWINTPTGLADTAWQTFRFVIRPDRMELWRDKFENGDWVLEQTMILPSTEEAPEIARVWGYYNYFERLEGLRLSWRATSLPRDQVFVDFVRVEVEDFGTPFAYWIREYFDSTVVEDPAAMNRFAPDGDASGDGLRNQVAYFFGLAPDERHDAGAVVQVVFGEDEVVVLYPRSWYAYGLDGGVEWSTNLIDWYRHGVVERRLEDTIDPADTDADVIHRATYYDRPEVVRGAWTIEATVPRPPDDAPVFVRIWTEDLPAAE
ncbi:MAG: hypothetical protein JJT96_19365 [Opitutales bacterium]|nr:hypothetical protein [Opitutales bacterium]